MTKEEAYKMVKDKQDLLFESFREHSEAIENINRELHDLWNEYHKKWLSE